MTVERTRASPATILATPAVNLTMVPEKSSVDVNKIDSNFLISSILAFLFAEADVSYIAT